MPFVTRTEAWASTSTQSARASAPQSATVNLDELM